MKVNLLGRRRGFTLIETLIAIGVLTVLLTAFLMVFGPAAGGIRRALNVQEADRLSSTLEEELITLHSGTDDAFTTGFAKAYKWIEKSNTADQAILVYQYRARFTKPLRSDGTPEPEPTIEGKLPGKDYTLQTMVRRKSDPLFLEDLDAIEGGVYLVKCTQLIFKNGELKAGTAGTIVDPKEGGTASASADEYPQAVIAFAADFYPLATRNRSYFESAGGFAKAFAKVEKPVFSRNLAVRR